VSNPAPPPILLPGDSSDNTALPSTDYRNLDLFKICEQKFLITEWAQKEGHIPEQVRYRINESILQESLIKIRLLEESIVRNPVPGQQGFTGTSVNIAIGERSTVMQTRDVIGSSLVTGDHNTVKTVMRQVAAPLAHKVDVNAELAALQQILAELKRVPDRGRLDQAMQVAVEEAAKPDPDKEWVGTALDRVAKSAKAASDFTENAEKIVPRLVALGSWLGPAGRALLNTLGVAI